MKPGLLKPRPASITPLVLIALVVWLLLAFVAAQSTLWDRDEPRYATAALEMVHSGNFLYPTFNHELRAFQPVLIYWLMAAGIELLGPGELSVRLASTLAIAMACFLTGLIAREFLKTGALAATLAGTTPMLVLTGTAATTDATLLMFILLAQWVFVRAWLDGPRPWHVPVLGAAIGLAMLTKGPFGLLVPVLTIGTCLLLARGRSAAGPFAGKLTAAALLGIGIFLAWGVPANAATGGEYWRIAIVERLPQRMFTAMEGHGGEGLVPFLLHLPYYPVVLALGFLPWTIYLALVPSSFCRGEHPAENQWPRSREGLRVLLTGMTLPVIVLMTLIVSKLPHYIQPVFPWLAILLAAALAGNSQAPQTAARRLRAAFLIFGPVGFLVSAALIAAPWFWPPLAVFRGAGIILGSFLAGLLALLAWCFWRDRLLTAVKIHAAAMAVWILACASLVLPPLETLVKPAQTLAREIAPRIPVGASIASYGWHEGSIHFYLGARKIHHLKNPEALAEWLAGTGPQVLIFLESEGPAPVPADFHRLTTREGINVVRGQPIRLTAYLRP